MQLIAVRRGAAPQTIGTAADVAGIDAEAAAFQQGAHGFFAQEVQARAAGIPGFHVCTASTNV